MTDEKETCQTLSKTESIDFMEIYKKELEETKAKGETNKDKILAKLKELGITLVTVSYEGAGDSGDFEDAALIPADIEKGVSEDALSVNTVTILVKESIFKDGKWEAKQHEKEVPLSVAIQDMTYDLLEASHPGWELNEGSDGHFYIDVENGMVRLSHTNYYTTHEEFETEF